MPFTIRRRLNPRSTLAVTLGAGLLTLSTPAAAESDPRIASQLLREVCIGHDASPEGIVRLATEFGLPKLKQASLEDPVLRSRPLDFHQLVNVQLNDLPLLFSVRHRLLREPGLQPVSWTECLVDVQRPGLRDLLSADIATVAGAPVRHGETNYWAFRVDNGKAERMPVHTRRDLLWHVQLAQGLKPSELLMMISVDGQEPITSLRVDTYRIAST